MEIVGRLLVDMAQCCTEQELCNLVVKTAHKMLATVPSLEKPVTPIIGTVY